MSGYACMECGYKFRTLKAAEKAAFGAKGCPRCGSSDVDIATGPLAGAVAKHKLETNPKEN